MTPATKKARKWAIITAITSFLLMAVPLCIFVGIGFKKTDVNGKVCISFIGIMAIVLTVLMVLMKVKLRRTLFWLVMIAVYIGFSKMQNVIFTMATCNVIDEVIVSPIHKYYVAKYIRNKDMDEREKLNG